MSHARLAHRPARRLVAARLALAAAALLAAPAARAQFPIVEPFTNATAPGWSLLGNAALTGGGIDAAGAGWLRLTSAGTDQAGTAIFNTAFPSSNGIAITFDYADYGGTGADGFSFYLLDGATASPTVGSSGGPLGYAAKYSNATCATGPLTVTIPGITNGYVGIGFDEWGNFSACESGVAGIGRTPQAVVIRGSGTRVAAGGTQTAFRYLTGVTVASAGGFTAIDNVARATPRKARVSIVNQRITVSMDAGAGFVTLINGYNLATATGQAALPATFKMGLSGSTGGSTNIHEIRNVRVDLPANLTLGQTITPSSIAVGGTVTFSITVANDATNASPNSTLTDAFPAGLANVAWTVATAGGATVTRASGTGNLAESVTLPRSSSVTYTVTATVAAAAAGQVLTNTVTLAPPPGVANLLSNTASANLTVARMTTATSLSTSGTPSRFGQPVTLTATVGAVAPGSGTPTGTVTFSDGATVLGTGTLSGGVATLTTSALAVGSHALTAAYGGAAAYATSTSGTVTQVVNQSLTTLVIATSANPTVAGQPVTITVSAFASAPGAGIPSGTVTLSDNGTILGTAALDATGVATFTTSALAVGTHPLMAAYGGSTSFAAASIGLSQQVGQASALVALASSVNPSRLGQPVTLTATVSAVAPGAGTPTGTVTFLDGATVLGTGAVSGGVATFSTSALAVGTHALTASYGGDVNLKPASSAAVSQVVNQAATATALATSGTPSRAGQALTLTATVTVTAPGAGALSGTVTFLDGATVLGTGAVNAAGVATLTSSALAVGTHTLTASFGGTAGLAGSTSAGLSQVVNQSATATALASSANPSVSGQAVTLTATVTVTAPGTGTPSGTVTFLDGATVLGTSALNGAGVATFTTSALAVGSHTLTAASGGSTAFAASTSPALAQTVGKAASATALAAGPSPSLFGEAVTLTATVTAVAPGTGTPSGTVTFTDGATVLGTAALDGAGVATLATSSLEVGTHALGAAYAGSGAFLASAAPAATQQVAPAATTTALSASLLAATFGDPVTFTAAVAVAAPGAGTPTGLVRFLADGVTLADVPLDATGHAPLTTSGAALAVGGRTITAAYLGTARFDPSAAAPVTVAVSRAASSAALAASANPSVTGQAVTLTATVTVPAGLPAASGTVTFLDGAAVLGTGTLSGGTATFITTGLAPGAHTLTAVFGGDASYLGATSAALAQAVNPAATATALAAAPSPSTFGGTVTLQAAVTALAPGAGTPSGTVTFLDGATTLGTAALDASGQASLQVATLTGGSHALTARFEGSTAFAASTSAPAAHQVGAAPTTLLLATSKSPTVLGEAALLTATVAPVAAGLGTPTGTVTFSEGAVVLGTAPLLGGVATLPLASLPVGVHALTAAYAGTADFAPSTGGVAQAVGQASADVVVAAAPSPAVTGQPVTIAVVVSARAPGAGLPGGQVRLLDGGVPVATLTLSGGASTLLRADLPVGLHPLTAEYLGDAGFLPATSAAPFGLAIDPAATTTDLATSAPAAAFGEPVTLTASVAVAAPGAGSPTGTVTFSEAGTTVGTATVDAAGQARLDLASLPVGGHDLVATYGGDPAFALSLSAPVHVDVALGAATVALSANPSPSVTGQAVTFTVAVAPIAPSTATPGGTVTLREGGVVLGTVALSGGVATLDLATLAPGPHLVTAEYAGDAGFSPAAAAPLAHQVELAPTATALAAAPTPSRQGEPVRLTAQVTAVAPGAGQPGGSVTFLDGTTVLGTVALDAAGQAELDAPLDAGPHTLTAVASGDAGFLGSTSAPLDQPVDLGLTGTAVAASPAAITYGQPVLLTAAVTVQAPAAGAPAGQVAFTVDGQAAGTAPLDAAGVASLSLAAGDLHGGLHEVVATFLGEARFAGSASAAQPLPVGPAAVVLELAAAPGLPVAGQPVLLLVTATSPAGVPAGPIAFLDGAATLGSAALDASGVAILPVGPLAVGSHPLTATFAGSADWQPATTGGAVTVARAATATAVAALPAAPVSGQPVAFDAAVTVPAPGHGTPSGTVTFLVDGVAVATVPVDAAGHATFTTAALPPGVHTVTASYGGDPALAGSTSPAAATVAVGQAPTALALSAAPSPSVTGQAVTLTAAVTVPAPGAGTPAGTVTFSDGVTVLGSAPLDAAGRATLTTASLAPGPHALTAAWPGDAALLGASGPAAHTVGQASTTTEVAATPAASTFGETIALTATVAPVAPGAGTPTGTVTFSEGATVLGSASLDGSGHATLAGVSLGAGAHPIAATYAGDAGFLASAAAAPATATVARAPAQVALTASPSPADAGQVVTLTATVTLASGTPAGTVTFLDGTTVLGTAPIGPGGVATLPVGPLRTGGHAITVTWPGDTDHQPGTGGATLTVVGAPSAVAVASSRNPSRRGRPVTFTATVTAAGGTPTGSVVFRDGAPGVGGLVLGTAPLDGGVATFTTRDLVKGLHPVTADYQGDVTFDPSTGTLPGGERVENTPPVAGGGTALTFGGAPGAALHATIPDPEGRLSAPQGTVELWARAGWTDATAPAAAPTLAALGGATSTRWSLAVAPDRRHLLVATGGVQVSLPARLDDGGWHHLALAGGDVATAVTVDAVEVGRVEAPFGDGPADALTLGDGFAGELDEVRCWSAPRDAASLADAARRPVLAAAPPLLGLWRLDEGAGTELFDAGPGHLDGALTFADPPVAAPAAFVPSAAWRHRTAATGVPMAPAAAGYDADGDPLALAITAPPAHGAAEGDAAALAVGYTSAAGFAGADAVTFELSDGEATGAYTLEIAVTAPAVCQATRDCPTGDLCVAGVCTPTSGMDVRAGGCGCTTGGGEALALWSLLGLGAGLLRRPRRTRRSAEGGGR